jgi:hypothetical protein
MAARAAPRTKGTKPKGHTRTAATVAGPAAAKRRVVVYLPAPLARRLRVHCASEDTDVSGYVAAVLAAALRPRRARG